MVLDRRNLLLIRLGDGNTDEVVLKTLAYALRRAAQLVFQIEEQELAVELIGDHAHRRVLLWEAAEGGIGVAERLVLQTDLVQQLARHALEIVHVDPGTGADDSSGGRCEGVCYDCLLAYSNQIDHRYLDRRRIVPILLALANSTVAPGNENRSYEEQYAWLKERLDPASTFEQEFLDEIHFRKLTLPDYAQYCPADSIAVQVDFYYDRGPSPGVCIFIDGPSHAASQRQDTDRSNDAALKAAGFQIVRITAGKGLYEQILLNSDVFK